MVYFLRDFEERKNAIIDALLVKANILGDAHLTISSEQVPYSFRKGLNYNNKLENEENQKKTKDEKLELTIEEEKKEISENEVFKESPIKVNFYIFFIFFLGDLKFIKQKRN